MNVSVQWRTCSTLNSGQIRIGEVDGDPSTVELTRTQDKCLALMVLEANIKPKSGASVALEVAGQPNPDFDTWLGMYLAARSLSGKGWPEDTHANYEDSLARAQVGTIFPEQDKTHGHLGVLRMAAYAQRERMNMPIYCPIPDRLSSLHLALKRLFPNDFKRWDEAWKVLEQQCRSRNPMLESVLDVDTNSHKCIESVRKRLQQDHEAYQRDLCRARKDYAEYAVLKAANTDGKGPSTRPVEMLHIAEPESLLFDVWAWEDTCNSKEKSGFPLVWIERGWDRDGFELRLNRARTDLLPLRDQLGLKNLSKAEEDEGWTLRFNGDAEAIKEVIANVRVALKKGLFPEGTCIKVSDISCNLKSEENGGHEDPKSQEFFIPLEVAIHDSDLDIAARIPQTIKNGESYLLKPNSYRWAQIEYSSDVDIYKTWAGDEFAAILYSVLRPEPSMRLPNKFVEEHVYRQTNIVSVWTREGVVVAVKQGSKEAHDVAALLHEQLNKAAELEGQLAQLTREDDPKAPSEKRIRADRVRKLSISHLKLRHEIARPELRTIRMFIDKLHAQDVYTTLRQSESERNEQETLDKQQKTLDQMHETSLKLDWLELFIFGVYITEAANILGDFF